MLKALPWVCVLDFSRHNHRVSQFFYHLVLRPITPKIQLSSNSLTVLTTHPVAEKKNSYDQRRLNSETSQNRTYRWQLVDLRDDLLVPLDRLPGARPQRGAEVAEATAGRQHPPRHHPHFPPVLVSDATNKRTS